MSIEILTEPEFTILTTEAGIIEQLKNIEIAGRTCYKSEKGEITFDTAIAFFLKLLGLGHESVFEHSLITVKLLLSRAAAQELTRHRHIGISHESTRYVNSAVKGFCFLFPRFKNLEDKIHIPILDKDMTLNDVITMLYQIYEALTKKLDWAPEDARQFLPLGLATEIVISTNLREWMHIFELRTDIKAHWEIRLVMCELLQEFKKILPNLFDDFVYIGLDKNGIPYYKRKLNQRSLMDRFVVTIMDMDKEKLNLLKKNIIKEQERRKH